MIGWVAHICRVPQVPRRVVRRVRSFGPVECYSNSAEIVYAASDMSQVTLRTLGLQQTWQSSTYVCFVPAEESTIVSFHSPHPAH
jgi:hypothetical protein